MKRIPSTAGRGLAGLLFVGMLTLGVFKAQGCQRPIDEAPEAEPVTEKTEPQTNAAEPAPAATVAQPVPAAVAESVDAGTDASSAKVEAEEDVDEPRPMMPATKSGMPVRVPQQQNAAPQKQKAD